MPRAASSAGARICWSPRAARGSELRAIALKGRDQPALVPVDDMAHLQPSIILGGSEPGKYSPAGDELWLRDQVLDQQIVDIEGRRLVRANDLQLVRNGGDGRFFLVGVDTGTRSLLRRIGVENAAKASGG